MSTNVSIKVMFHREWLMAGCTFIGLFTSMSTNMWIKTGFVSERCLACCALVRFLSWVCKECDADMICARRSQQPPSGHHIVFLLRYQNKMMLIYQRASFTGQFQTCSFEQSTQIRYSSDTPSGLLDTLFLPQWSQEHAYKTEGYRNTGQNTNSYQITNKCSILHLAEV